MDFSKEGMLAAPGAEAGQPSPGKALVLALWFC